MSTIVDSRYPRSSLVAAPSWPTQTVVSGPLDIIPPPDVPLWDGTTIPYLNLDYAASAPCVRAASDAVASLLPRYSAVHRGAGWLSTECTRAYESARESVAAFLGCRFDDEVIFTKHTTEALNVLAHVLPPKTTVVGFESEHHANLLPWPGLITLPTPRSHNEAVRSIGAALSVLGDEAPVLVTITAASNVTGELFPVREIIQLAHRFGARVVIDAAQLVAHRRTDITDWDADYVVFSGHKLYAPFGTGVLAGRRDWLDAGAPLLLGGGATASVGDATGDVTWRTGSARHEAGSPNVMGAVALGAVCDALRAADWELLAAHEDSLRARLVSRLTRINRVRLLQLFSDKVEQVATVAFVIDGLPSELVAAALSAEHGIGVRDGLFCAHPLTRRLVRQSGVKGFPEKDPANSTQGIRASFGFGTDVADIDRLANAVEKLATVGPSASYIRVDNRLSAIPSNTKDQSARDTASPAPHHGPV